MAAALHRQDRRAAGARGSEVSADCIETLEEIAGEAAEIFKHAGGENFAHIPCLNDSPEGMRVIEALVRRELSGWVEV